MTTTAQNTNISPNSPARKSPGNALCPQNLGRIAAISPLPTSRPPPHLPPPQKKYIYIYIPQRETRRKFPILRNEQIHTVYKQSQKMQNAHNFLFLQIYLYIAEKWCESNEAYLSNVFFTKSARTFIRFPWFDTIFKFL